MTAERWLPVVGYEGYYEVSDLGRVRSMFRVVPVRQTGKRSPPFVTVEGRLMRQQIDRKGYPTVGLKLNGSRKNLSVHRLVMKAFVPRSDADDLQVNHCDGVKANSVLLNLEWCDAAHNMRHAIHVLKCRRAEPVYGGNHPSAKAVIGTCLATGAVQHFPSIVDTAHAGFSPTAVQCAIRGKSKSSKGFSWRFAEIAAPAAVKETESC